MSNSLLEVYLYVKVFCSVVVVYDVKVLPLIEVSKCALHPPVNFIALVLPNMLTAPPLFSLRFVV